MITSFKDYSPNGYNKYIHGVFDNMEKCKRGCW